MMTGFEAEERSEVYEPPSYETISADSLESSMALMSSGGGGGGSTTYYYYYYAYLAIASASVFTLGHAALVLRRKIRSSTGSITDTMYLYSFTADPNDVMNDLLGGLYIGVEGTVSRLNSNGNLVHKSSDTSGREWSKFITDNTVYYSENDSDTYDHWIGVQISNSQYAAAKSAADLCVNEMGNVNTRYSILNNNCADLAMKILSYYSKIDIIYNAEVAMIALEAKIAIIATLLQAAFPSYTYVAIAAALNGLLFAASLDGTIPTIPNYVYEYYNRVNGSSYDTGSRFTI